MNPAVVVIAYNRPQALSRLLASLDRADYPVGGAVPLVISIDRTREGTSEGVKAVADAFEWRYGPKQVLVHEERLGLVRHFRECGRLSQAYEGVVLLEDDLTVSAPFYAFASQALSCYAGDARVAGTCLYGLWFNGFTREPFEAVADGADVFFLRLPYTQGLAFTAEQWRRFDDAWQPARPQPHPDLHSAFLDFPADEWFPALASYTTAQRRYFVFPRTSLTVAWGDAGSHFSATTNWLQAPVQLRGGAYRLPAFDDALAVYDGFFELEPDRLRSLACPLAVPAFDVDLNATKRPENLHSDHVLTTRPVRRALTRFGLRLQPVEMNIIEAVPGEDIALAHRNDVHWDSWAGREARRRLFGQAWSRYRPSRRRQLGFALAGFFNRLRVKVSSRRGPD